MAVTASVWTGATALSAFEFDVITAFVVLADDTATTLRLPEATALHGLSRAEVRLVQLMPSKLVITRLPVPDSATATNSPPVKVTAFQL